MRNPCGSAALPCKAWAIITGDGIRRCPVTGTMGVFIDLSVARLTEAHHRETGMDPAEVVDVTIVASADLHDLKRRAADDAEIIAALRQRLGIETGDAGPATPPPA